MLHEPIYHEMYRMGELGGRQEVGSCETGSHGGVGGQGQASLKGPLGKVECPKLDCG